MTTKFTQKKRIWHLKQASPRPQLPSQLPWGQTHLPDTASNSKLNIFPVYWTSLTHANIQTAHRDHLFTFAPVYWIKIRLHHLCCRYLYQPSNVPVAYISMAVISYLWFMLQCKGWTCLPMYLSGFLIVWLDLHNITRPGFLESGVLTSKLYFSWRLLLSLLEYNRWLRWIAYLSSASFVAPPLVSSSLCLPLCLCVCLSLYKAVCDSPRQSVRYWEQTLKSKEAT